MKLNIWKASYEWSYKYYEQKEDRFKTLLVPTIKHVATKNKCLIEWIDEIETLNGVLI